MVRFSAVVTSWVLPPWALFGCHYFFAAYTSACLVLQFPFLCSKRSVTTSILATLGFASKAVARILYNSGKLANKCMEWSSSATGSPATDSPLKTCHCFDVFLDSHCLSIAKSEVYDTVLACWPMSSFGIDLPTSAK